MECALDRMSRLKNFTSVLVIAICMSYLQACAVAPDRPASVGLTNELSSQQVSVEVDNLKEGDMVNFQTGPLAKLGTITVGRHYNAASGRNCKQILGASGKQLLSVACQLPTNQWYIRESVQNPAGAIQIIPVRSDLNNVRVPTKSQTLELKQPIKEPVSYNVKPDETLYSFAHRTTGNASNWKRIAQHNGVTDEFALVVGAVLEIPFDLQSAGR